jgi:hypothetical protein
MDSIEKGMGAGDRRAYKTFLFGKTPAQCQLLQMPGIVPKRHPVSRQLP